MAYMHAGHPKHEESELLPHLEPVIQPLGETAVLSPSPQLDVRR